MQVDKSQVENTYKFVGLNRNKLHDCLRTMGRGYVENNFKSKWESTNPTFAYSYFITEFLYHYVAPLGSKVMTVWIKPLEQGQRGRNHWFVQWPDDTVVDLAVEQFEEYPNYNQAYETNLRVPSPTATAKRLARLMGYSDDDLDIEYESNKPKKKFNKLLKNSRKRK